MKLNFLLPVIVIVALYDGRVTSHPMVMKNILVHFVKPLIKCQQEMSLPHSIYNDFYNFWTEGYEITNNATGCAMICLAAKLNLIVNGPRSRINFDLCLHHIKRRGADENTADKILYHLRQCEAMAQREADSCVRVLKSTNCFRNAIHSLNWAPQLAEVF